MSKYVFLQRYSAGQLGGGLSICKSGLNSAEENILLLHNHCFCVHSNLLENVKILSHMKRDNILAIWQIFAAHPKKLWKLKVDKLTFAKSNLNFPKAAKIVELLLNILTDILIPEEQAEEAPIKISFFSATSGPAPSEF